MQPADQSIFDESTYRTSPPTSARPRPRLYRGRAWLAALAAVLTELVVIAGLDNQGVTAKLRDPLDDPNRVFADYSRGAIDAATTFWWRFAPADGQATHVWAAQFAGIGVLLVLTWLGTMAVARGSVTFGRVFIGTWALVAALAPIAIMVRNVLVTPTAPGPAQSRIGQSVYGYDAFGPVLVAGIALGLVTGLIAAAVAVSSRRHIAAAPGPVLGTGEQDEYYDESFTPRYTSPPMYEPRPWGESQWQGATTQLPQVTQDDQPTTSVPVVPPQQEQWHEQPSYGVATSQSEPEPSAGPVASAEPAPSDEPPADQDAHPTQALPAQEQSVQEQQRRQTADEEMLAEELAVDEHTQELPHVTGEPDRPHRESRESRE